MANTPVTTGISWAVVTNVDPTALDSDYPRWFGWCNTTNNKIFDLVDNTPDNAVWKERVYS
jgi:hypothetical protein